MIINTDDYNEIDDYSFLEYYLEDSLYLRIGHAKPKYYIKKGSTPKLDQIFDRELGILVELIQSNATKSQINGQASKILDLKKTFQGLPCSKLDTFIEVWRMS